MRARRPALGGLACAHWIEAAGLEPAAQSALEPCCRTIERAYGRVPLTFGAWHGDLVPMEPCSVRFSAVRLGLGTARRTRRWVLTQCTYYFQVAFIARQRPLAEAAAQAADRAGVALRALGVPQEARRLVPVLHLLELAVRHEEARSSTGDIDARFYPAVTGVLEQALTQPGGLLGLAVGRASGMKALLVCSPGGHLAQLYRLRPWWAGHERTWVTLADPQTESLLAGERVILAFGPTTRNIPNALRNLRLARRVIHAEQPDVIISDGAGLAFPFFVMARLLGVRTVYLEAYDRISRPTLTGRLCYPIAGLFLLQWPEQAVNYPRGVVIGCLL